jgi:hypothetical protein
MTSDAPQKRTVAITADTWIDAAKQSTTHGNDQDLYVVGGGTDERRVLLQLTLPGVPPGAWLLEARLILSVQSNADATLAERGLALHRLTQPFVENRATWLSFTNGVGNTWDTPGGDFGLVPLSSAVLPANAAQGSLTFDATDSLRQLFSDQAVPLSLIILEVGSVPAAPAELAFAATEGDASDPSLVIDFCQP